CLMAEELVWSAGAPRLSSYIQLLQDDVEKSLLRPLDRGKAEGDRDDAPGRPASHTQRPRGPPTLPPLPFSVPQSLTVSPVLGGFPVSTEQAVELRKILFGNTFHIFSYEWKKSFFKFREPNSELSYTLEAERGGTRAVQIVIQANIIKHLLFGPHADQHGGLPVLGEKDQDRALTAALADVLWTAGEDQAATVSLATWTISFTPPPGYKLDSITERLHLFSFSRKEDVQKFICEHIRCFKEEGSHGVILLLCSLVFSRTTDRLRQDLDATTSHLLQPSFGSFVCRQALLNLLLTGRATPHVFNGTVQYDEAGRLLERPLRGVLTRSDIGYLHWSREQGRGSKLLKVGSMLKTPRLPIWVCSINGTYSVLFSPNRSLLSDWRMEHLFKLYFYTGQPTQTSTALLTIDTHSHHWELKALDAHEDPEKKFPSLEMTIRTKWEGAAINWNGTVPFF
ncbi:protein FAM188B2, partial [Arapaima gigas]